MLEQYTVGDLMDDHALVRELVLRQDRKGNNFLSLALQDKTRIMDAKFWHVNEAIIKQIKQGMVVHFKGELTEFNGRPQVKLSYLKEAEEPYSDLSRYIDGAPMSTMEMKEELAEYIDAMSPKLQKIMSCLFEEYGSQYYIAAAAKTNHHNYSGGLAYHTLSMLSLAKNIATQYENIDRGLLYAGVICHDFGKIWEMTQGKNIEYTLQGDLLGHLTMMSEAITVICLQNDIPLDKEVLYLKHLILAHHGKLEFASPVVPKLLEAEVLHQIDYMDASMNMMTTALNHTTKGQFTDRLNAMEGRSFYKK